MQLRLALALSVSIASLAACGDDGAGTHAIMKVDADATDFYDLPFPSNLRRTDDGHLDLSALPTNAPIVQQLRDATAELDGFSLNSAIYALFDGPIDPASLPDPAASITDAASVYLVDVDMQSPDYGKKVPIVARFHPDGYQTLPANSLSVRPYPGFVLREGNTYGLVITNRVTDPGGSPVGAGADTRAVFDGDAKATAANHAYLELLVWLATGGGSDGVTNVVSMTEFTTQHATRFVPMLQAAVAAAPSPRATDIVAKTTTSQFTVFTGTYMAPNFQAGDPPYKNAPTGRIDYGPDGKAVVQRTETLRFSLVVPAGAVPTGGFPIAIYSHGTGGDYLSDVDDGTAQRLAAEGIATLSMDQVLHGPRNPGGSPDLDFFNIGNIYAFRDNVLQGYADAFSQLRLIQEGLAFTEPDAQPPRDLTFDKTNVFFFGHSQGGLTGPGFVAFEPTLKGAVLSGTAGLLYLNLLHKTEPLNIPALVETFIRDEPVDEDNPSLALVQIWADRSDPANYAPLMVRQPVPGVPPRPIFQTEGFTDSYAPNIGIEAFATALGGDIVAEPAMKPVEGLALRGRTVMTPPITDNLNGVTAVLAQYNQLQNSDGHFVVFDIPAAKQQAARFLGTLASTGHATVVPAN